jgi:hypothetical protein
MSGSRAGGGVVALGVVLLLAASATAAVPPVTQTFSYTGARQMFTVPDKVTSLQITAQGAGGGSEFGSGSGGSATIRPIRPG